MVNGTSSHLHDCIVKNDNEGSKLFVCDTLCDVCELV